MTERTCPICESKFTAQRVTSLTCGAACSNKAKKLRSAMKAFNAGKRDLRPKTLEQAMRLLEADEIISASKAQREAAEVLDDEVDDPAEDQRWRNAYARRQAVERKWMLDWRYAKYRLTLRYLSEGKRLPMWATPRMVEKARAAYPDGIPDDA
ncbi:hypothetical protein [Phaeobacter italicus]|uniref:hypothetical protein n=1 Tax=Phaeobacter italicus TaxID=481446 RepID=UPI001C96E7C5|nr:hypothetical protein [Phaeobacter italicus]MBY6043626.1 hypothetical protein [Phaeobacter italicus]